MKSNLRVRSILAKSISSSNITFFCFFVLGVVNFFDNHNSEMRTKKFLLQYHWILALGHLLDIVKKIITILSIQLAPNNHFYTFVEIHNFVSKQLDPCDNRYIYIQLYTNTMMIRTDALMIRTDTCLFIYFSIHSTFVDEIRLDSVTIIVFVCSLMDNLNCNNHNLSISSTLRSGFAPISNTWAQTQKQLHFWHRWNDGLFLGGCDFVLFGL